MLSYALYYCLIIICRTIYILTESDADDGPPYSSDEPKYIWRNVTRNGMIKKCVLVDGIMEGGRPKPGDAVLVKSQGKLKDGRIIDDEPSMVFNIGDYEVIEGLDLVVQSMYKNELSIFSIKVSWKIAYIYFF